MAQLALQAMLNCAQAVAAADSRRGDGDGGPPDGDGGGPGSGPGGGNPGNGGDPGDGPDDGCGPAEVVVTGPASAQVEVDGFLASALPLPSALLAAGVHVVRTRAPSGEGGAARLDVRAGETRVLRLPAASGQVDLPRAEP